MARYSGKIGYLITVEEEINGEKTGICKEKYIERQAYGDVIQNYSKWDSANQLNDNISVNNKISIVADPFALANFQHIKYATWMKQKWKVSTIEPNYPRLILNIGGIYNDDEDGFA